MCHVHGTGLRSTVQVITTSSSYEAGVGDDGGRGGRSG